jgi:hypothetical protein
VLRAEALGDAQVPALLHHAATVNAAAQREKKLPSLPTATAAVS